MEVETGEDCLEELCRVAGLVGTEAGQVPLEDLEESGSGDTNPVHRVVEGEDTQHVLPCDLPRLQTGPQSPVIDEGNLGEC